MAETRRIFIHGWGTSPRVFDAIAAAGPARALMPALPGYAGSRWPFVADFSAQVEAIASDLPGGHLIGWSLGGLYAIELARRFPTRYPELTLIASNPCFSARADWPFALDATLLAQFHLELSRDWRRTLKRFLALQAQGDDASRQLLRDLSKAIAGDGTPDLAALEFGLQLLRRLDLRDSLARLEQPVSLILGERDRLVPVALGQQIAEVLPGIRVKSIAGAAHAPFLSHPAQCNALLPLR